MLHGFTLTLTILLTASALCVFQKQTPGPVGDAHSIIPSLLYLTTFRSPFGSTKSSQGPFVGAAVVDVVVVGAAVVVVVVVGAAVVVVVVVDVVVVVGTAVVVVVVVDVVVVVGTAVLDVVGALHQPSPPGMGALPHMIGLYITGSLFLTRSTKPTGVVWLFGSVRLYK